MRHYQLLHLDDLHPATESERNLYAASCFGGSTAANLAYVFSYLARYLCAQTVPALCWLQDYTCVAT
jgi:hypothetical protein